MVFCDLRVLARTLASPFGHPIQVSTQVQHASTCDYLPVRLTRALRQLKRATGDPAQLLNCFYTTCIRPVSEYACQVLHNGLLEYLSEELEKIYRRALRIIFPDLSYQETLKECNIATLHQRRQ